MFTLHHGIARQGVVSTSYIMSYNVRSVTSGFSLGVVTHYVKSFIVLPCGYGVFYLFSFLSFLSSPRPILGPTLSRETRKTTRRHDILGQLRTVSKFVPGKTGSSMDFTKVSKL